MSLIYKEHELELVKGKNFSIQHIQSLLEGVPLQRAEQSDAQRDQDRTATMQNSKVQELMSSFERAEADDAARALLEAKQPAVRITTSKRDGLNEDQGSLVQLVIPEVHPPPSNMVNHHASIFDSVRSISLKQKAQDQLNGVQREQHRSLIKLARMIE